MTILARWAIITIQLPQLAPPPDILPIRIVILLLRVTGLVLTTVYVNAYLVRGWLRFQLQFVAYNLLIICFRDIKFLITSGRLHGRFILLTWVTGLGLTTVLFYYQFVSK